MAELSDGSDGVSLVARFNGTTFRGAPIATQRLPNRLSRPLNHLNFGDPVPIPLFPKISLTVTRILQLTDLHVFAEPQQQLKGIPTRECLEDVIAHIVATEAPFDRVIITGDHTHDEQPASYEAVRELLSPWHDRLWQVPGNHDDRRILRDTFHDRVSGDGDERITFHFSVGPWLCAGLDTHVPGEVSGEIDADQIRQWKQLLKESPAERIALFLHHPPIDVDSIWMDQIGLSGREMLHELVEDDRRIKLICCGHVHHEFEGMLEHAEVFATPATGIQFDPVGEEPNFATAAPGYRVIEFDGKWHSTHVVRLPETKYSPVTD